MQKTDSKPRLVHEARISLYMYANEVTRRNKQRSDWLKLTILHDGESQLVQPRTTARDSKLIGLFKTKDFEVEVKFLGVWLHDPLTDWLHWTSAKGISERL